MSDGNHHHALCRVHTSCQRPECEFRRLPWELSAQVEAQRRCAKKRKEEDRKNDVCGAERDPRDEGKDDENKEKDFESDDDVEDLINECINEQKEKEQAIQESFKKDVTNAIQMELGAVVDPKTGRILERIERVQMKANQLTALRGRRLNQMRKVREKAAQREQMMRQQQQQQQQ